MTLNGMAQGLATDRVARPLSRAGFGMVMVDAGEIRASGDGAGSGWPAGWPGGRTIRRNDRAVATSEPRGTMVHAEADIGHIFDPQGTRPRMRREPVTVLRENAAVAGAAFTAAVVPEDRKLALLQEIDAEIIRAIRNGFEPCASATFFGHCRGNLFSTSIHTGKETGNADEKSRTDERRGYCRAAHRL
ncbi:MAG: FAD:protein FMN transferase [Paracoccaceae bacterium]